MKTYTYDELDRYGYNIRILELIDKEFMPSIMKDGDVLLYEVMCDLVNEMRSCVNNFVDQRFGQIIQNYGRNMVKDFDKGDVALDMFEDFVFGQGRNHDIFFEESRVTFENLEKRLSDESLANDGFTYRHVGFEHPKNEEGVFWDLVGKWKKFGTLYIGVDFDNTLLPYGHDDIWEDGEMKVSQGFMDVLSLLRWCKLLGMKLCLWSLPESVENLEWKVEWCRSHGIEMDFVNESPLLDELSKQWGKVHFNLLLDDVAGLESSFSVLYNLCEWIDGHEED